MTHQPCAKPRGRLALIALLAKDISYKNKPPKYEIKRKEGKKK